MAAYSLQDRFSGPPKYFRFFDPGSYQYEKSKLKSNKVPFLSNVPRKTGERAILWTQAIYDASVPHNIPNIAAFKSKKSRFPYETFSEDDLKDILCKCGFENSCVCPEESEPTKPVTCQGKLKQRLFIGPTPRSILGDEGVSVPSRNDHGFVINNSDPQKRLRKEITDTGPPFYDARVNEFTAFYHGCKWSQRTSKRSHEFSEERPGPAHYYFKYEPTQEAICAEKVRAHKRKSSKQPRFIEIIQRRDILEGRPGPASYSPSFPKGTDLKFIGSKATRFFSDSLEGPGPTDYFLRRNFDPVDPPETLCHATLPQPPFFGIKSQRFKPKLEEGPSPATYNVKYETCRFLKCPTTPFGSSGVRFKPDVIDDNDDEISENNEKEISFTCPSPTSVFKSKTIRMKPLIKRNDEPSPADMKPDDIKYKRKPSMQYVAPFYSSEGRFQPWYNWIPVSGKLKTPTSCDYNTAKPANVSAVNRGPMFRTKRFPMSTSLTPAPNEYSVTGGVETVLKTHNKRLEDNIEHQHKFVWNPPAENPTLTYDQKEALLFEKCIDLLSSLDVFEDNEKVTNTNNDAISAPATISDNIENKDANKVDVDIQKDETVREAKNEPKMLRTFLYAHEIPKYF